MMTKVQADFIKSCSTAQDENAVRNAYRNLVGIKEWDAPFNCDGFYNNVLFEFKFSKALTSKDGSKALAQTCYYLKRFREEGFFNGRAYPVPEAVVVADDNEAFVVESKILESLYTSKDFDWKRAACNPDPKLVEACAAITGRVVFDVSTPQGVSLFLDKLESVKGAVSALKIITRDNFDTIFEVWKKEFAQDLPAQTAALAFLLDLENKSAVNRATGTVIFDFEGKSEHVKLTVPVGVYEAFWAMFKRPPTPKEMKAIYERKDRLVAMQNRRMEGEFFTPLTYAKKAHEYLAASIEDRYAGEGAHHSMYDDYDWFDPCCGSGNLTYHCPSEMKGKLFMSTLNQEDVDVVNGSGQNPEAVVFQFDFLNDDLEKMPKSMLERFKTQKRWIFILNPPFAAGTDLNASFGDKGEVKTGTSDTVIQKDMQVLKLGHACQNTYSQFLFRIKQIQEKFGLDIYIAVFSVATYISNQGFTKFLSLWETSFTYSSGFTFPAEEFQGTSGKWPVVFCIWKGVTK